MERADGSFQRPLHRHGWGINVLARLPGSERLVFGGAQRLGGDRRRRDRRDVSWSCPRHERPVLALAVLEKPGIIATGGGDGVIRVLRSADGSLIEEYRNPYGPVWALAFVADGTALYYGGLDDFATLWRIAPREPFEADRQPLPAPLPGARRRPSTRSRAGELQFARKCSVCHTLQADGRNRAGPTLHKVFGRRIGTLDGYPYSEALKKLDIVWTPETLGQAVRAGTRGLHAGVEDAPAEDDRHGAARCADRFPKLATEATSPLTATGRRPQNCTARETSNESLHLQPDRAGGDHGGIGGGAAVRADVGERRVLRAAERAAVGAWVATAAGRLAQPEPGATRRAVRSHVGIAIDSCQVCAGV